MCGQCADCKVDLVRVVGGEKASPLSYDTCESCGGIFLESEFSDVSDYVAAKKEILEFFGRFSTKGKKKVASAHA
jgi:hypothetical protein